MKAVQESPYSQINDPEELYAKPNMETVKSRQTSGIYTITYQLCTHASSLYIEDYYCN